ncbi:MAG: lactate racemase domain-containing protein [Blastocatellia bacterium]
MTENPLTSSLKSLPPQLLVEAKLASHPLADVAAETIARLELGCAGTDWTGRQVAVATGSRGIARIDEVVRATVAYLKSQGAHPFIVPCMGSHGGATAEGQAEMLGTLGVTEEAMGAPIRAEMETVEVGRSVSGAAVVMSPVIREADSVIIINRVKPHTDFVSGQIGSGVRKMCVIGLGKADGAFNFHRAASVAGYEPVMIEFSNIILNALPHAFGVGLVEDACHQMARIEVMPGPEIAAREPELFRLASGWMPRLPFGAIDVLVVDEMGKNISGSGMDTNVISRNIDGTRRTGTGVDVRAIYVRGLTPETHGNAIGLGFAEIVSAKLVREMDHNSTYINSLSSMTPASSRTPMHFDSDAECLGAALRMAGADAAGARFVRIRNTLALNRFVASASFAEEIAKRDDLQVVGAAQAWQFDAQGNIDTAADMLRS